MKGKNVYSPEDKQAWLISLSGPDTGMVVNPFHVSKDAALLQSSVCVSSVVTNFEGLCMIASSLGIRLTIRATESWLG